MAYRLWTHVAWIGILALTATASQAALLPDVTPVGQVALPYAHRFALGDRLVSTPTFSLAAGISRGLEASLRLALDSDIQRVRPEWEPRLTYQLVGGHSPWRLAIATAYNSAALSADAALLGSVQLGDVSLRGSSCAFSSGYGVGGPTGAMGFGLSWRLNEWLAASADYGGVIVARDLDAIANQLPPLGLTQAWRLGVLLGSDRERHFELYVTNSHTQSLQGLHRGSDQVQVGFEYRIPLQGFPPPAPEVPLPDLSGVPDPFTISMATASPAAHRPPSAAKAPVVRVVRAIARRPTTLPILRDLRQVRLVSRSHASSVLTVRMGPHGYAPAVLTVRRGTLVRWVNTDHLSHTATSRGGWDSLWKKPGRSFEVRFNRKGRFPYYCKRHPHEQGIVNVR